MTALPKQRYSLEEYLELDRTSDEKYEYFAGEVFALAGGSPEHSRISLNVGTSLRIKLRGSACEAFNSDMRIKVPTALPYRSPDLSVVCGTPFFESLQGQSMLVNPVLLIEVLSPSTTAYDLGEKFTAYQSIPTFREYLLIAQTRPHVIRHLYQAPGQWLRTEVSGLGNAVPLESLGLTLPLAEIYERVEFHREPPLG